MSAGYMFRASRALPNMVLDFFLNSYINRSRLSCKLGQLLYVFFCWVLGSYIFILGL